MFWFLISIICGSNHVVMRVIIRGKRGWFNLVKQHEVIYPKSSEIVTWFLVNHVFGWNHKNTKWIKTRNKKQETRNTPAPGAHTGRTRRAHTPHHTTPHHTTHHTPHNNSTQHHTTAHNTQQHATQCNAT